MAKRNGGLRGPPFLFLKADEAAHANEALAAGAAPLPEPVKGLMRAAAKVMTTTAHYI